MEIETGILDGKYKLKDEFGTSVPPEYFLDLFKDKPFYRDVKKFVRRVDNDTGIPFLIREEYEIAKRVLPEDLLGVYENEGFISQIQNKVYLRGKRYYINYQEKDEKDERSGAEFALELLRTSIREDIDFNKVINYSVEKSRTLEERMVVGSLLDLYRDHLMIVFTGLYESMKLDETIEAEHYNLIRREVEMIIDDYYRFIIEKKIPNTFIRQDKLNLFFESIGNVIRKTQSVYDGRRYLAREFDHPGRMVLYASHLLSQVKEKGRKYDLLVNLLNGSAEMGLATQTIDSILGTNNIRSTTIFEVDFARYSRKDRLDKDVSTYSEFENIAIPKQLRRMFRQKVENKDTLIVDDNLNTGQTLYYVQKALEEIARSVDISTAEVIPILRVIELIKEDNPEADPHNEIKLIESGLTYSPIGWWRDQRKLNKDKVIEKIISLE